MALNGVNEWPYLFFFIPSFLFSRFKTIYFHYLFIYKIKMSVHWSKSRQMLVAHFSSKVMNENTLNKIPVYVSVCMFVCVPRKVAPDSRKNGWRDHYEISYLDQMPSNLRLLLYNVLIFWPQKGVWRFGYYQITPKLLTLQQIVSWAKL